MGKNTSVWEGRKQSSDRLSSILAIEGHDFLGDSGRSAKAHGNGSYQRH